MSNNRKNDFTGEYVHEVEEADNMQEIWTQQGVFKIDLSNFTTAEQLLFRKYTRGESTLHRVEVLNDGTGMKFDTLDDSDLVLWENNPCRWYYLCIEDEVITGIYEVEPKFIEE